MSENRSRGWKFFSALLFRLLVPDEQIWWSLRARNRVRRLRVDAILISGPPFSQFLVSEAADSGAPVVLDYRDLWSVGPYFTARGLKARLAQYMERRSWRRAAAATTVSMPLVADLIAHAGIPVHLVMNGVDETEIAPDVDRLSSTAPLRIVYTGQLYGERRDPSPLFQALKRSNLGSEEVRVEFYGPDSKSVLKAARLHGVGELVSVSPAVDRQQIVNLQRQAGVLLLLLWNDPREAGVVTGKLFEYVAARRPILMLGWPDGVAARLIRDRALGVVANDPDALGHILRRWVDEFRRGALAQLPATNGRDLTREEQVRRLAAVLVAAHEETVGE